MNESERIRIELAFDGQQVLSVLVSLAAADQFLNSTLSQPFDAPQHGKIAVKVINHYGDEVMKVYDVAEAEERG